MFPNARNSLHRTSLSSSRQGSNNNNNNNNNNNDGDLPVQQLAPVPIAVTLYNASLADNKQQKDKQQTGTSSSSSSSSNTNNKKWFFFPSIQLVPVVSLEIILVDNFGPEIEQEETTTTTTTCCYSSVCQPRTIHPNWEHLNDAVAWQDYDYRQLRLQFKDYENDVVFHEISCVHPSVMKKVTDLPTTTLPINSCVVHYSDGSTRIPPCLHSLLLDYAIIADSTTSEKIEDFSRFDDQVFDALNNNYHLDNDISNVFDNVDLDNYGHNNMPLPSRQGPQRERIVSASSLLLPPAERERLQKELEQQQLEEKQQYERRLENARVLNLPLAEAIVESSSSPNPAQEEFLLAILEQEERLLEQEMKQLQEDKKLITALVQESKQVERETNMVKAELHTQSKLLRKDHYLVHAQSTKLIRELQDIYPISLSGEPFKIRQLGIPKRITLASEEISAALGYTCHLVFCMSKYLSIQLRFKLFCNASRSAIQQSDNKIYPLFTSSVDMEQLERGLFLLHANIDCILQTLQIKEVSSLPSTATTQSLQQPFKMRTHLLVKLNQVYQHFHDCHQESQQQQQQDG